MWVPTQKNCSARGASLVKHLTEKRERKARNERATRSVDSSRPILIYLSSLSLRFSDRRRKQNLRARFIFQHQKLKNAILDF